MLVGAGDAVPIAPGAWHQITNVGEGPLRILCCCAPPYRHEDTFFDDGRGRAGR
jgi:mannose-6-phosphate isomerase-like protein (cupin superfamily)